MFLAFGLKKKKNTMKNKQGSHSILACANNLSYMRSDQGLKHGVSWISRISGNFKVRFVNVIMRSQSSIDLGFRFRLILYYWTELQDDWTLNLTKPRTGYDKADRNDSKNATDTSIAISFISVLMWKPSALDWSIGFSILRRRINKAQTTLSVVA